MVHCISSHSPKEKRYQNKLPGLFQSHKETNVTTISQEERVHFASSLDTRSHSHQKKVVTPQEALAAVSVFQNTDLSLYPLAVLNDTTRRARLTPPRRHISVWSQLICATTASDERGQTPHCQ